MLHLLPPELRLEVLQYVFFQHPGRGIIKIDKVDENFNVRYKRDALQARYKGAMTLLDKNVVGQDIANAATEALYRSESMFELDAVNVPGFFKACPLSRPIRPGQLIEKLIVKMDEGPRFIGDRWNAMELRMADWIDLEQGDDEFNCQRVLRSGHRTHLMRSCWRSPAQTPKLKRLEVRVMPARGKVSKKEIYTWMMKDILPPCYQLSQMVQLKLYLRTWEKPPASGEKYDPLDGDCDDDDRYENYIDFTQCIHWEEFENERRISSAIIPGYDRGWATSPDPRLRSYHRIQNRDAIQDLMKRIKARTGLCSSDSDLKLGTKAR